MPDTRLPLRDPRTVARDIPGVLDVLFPRLSGGLVASLNRGLFLFREVSAVPDEEILNSNVQRALLFEIAVVRAERIMGGESNLAWEICLAEAASRMRRHFDIRIPEMLADEDKHIIARLAGNLEQMLGSVTDQRPGDSLSIRPQIPGMGWISSGVGDFAVGDVLIEVKHTDRNFIAADFRQVLLYWLLRYAASLGTSFDGWKHCLLINPRRNAGCWFDFDTLAKSASAGLGRVELYELLRAIVGRGDRWES